MRARRPGPRGGRGGGARGGGAPPPPQLPRRASPADKPGPTRDNPGGWFTLMPPQLVGGAWVGFNDNRITLRSDYWGQGARLSRIHISEPTRPY